MRLIRIHMPRVMLLYGRNSLLSKFPAYLKFNSSTRSLVVVPFSEQAFGKKSEKNYYLIIHRLFLLFAKNDRFSMVQGSSTYINQNHWNFLDWNCYSNWQHMFIFPHFLPPAKFCSAFYSMVPKLTIDSRHFWKDASEADTEVSSPSTSRRNRNFLSLMSAQL